MNRMFTAAIGDSFKQRASYSFNFSHNIVNNTALINAVTLDGPVRSTVVVPRTDMSTMGRVDDQITPNNTFTGGYRYFRSIRENNGVGQYSLESRGFPSHFTSREIRLVDTVVASNRIVTDMRFGYSRNATRQYGDTSIPSLIVSNSFNGGSAQTGQTSDVNIAVDAQNNTTVVHRAHTFRFGGQLRYTSVVNVAPSNFGGTFSFFGVATDTGPISSLEQYRRTVLYQGLGYSPEQIRRLGGGASQFSIAAGNPRVSFTQTEPVVYALDDWRARPSLTLSLGFRFEAQTNIHWKGLAPRVSLTWSPGKTVFRAGWGISYQHLDMGPTQQALRFNGTTEQQYVVMNPDFYPAIPPIASLAKQQSLTTYRFDSDTQATPWMLAAFSVERQLPAKTTVSAIYRNQRTTHVLDTVNVGNAAANVFQFEFGGIQKVNWVTLQVNNKLNQKISFNAQYSWMDAHNSNGYTDNGRWENAIPSNAHNLAADWGRAGWATNHSFNMFGTLTGPRGIQFSPFLLAYSGGPYNLTIGSDLNGDTVANDRPAFATDLSRPSVVRTKFGAFDTNPLPGQRIVPRNFLTGEPQWSFNVRVSKTFGLRAATDRYKINFNVDVNNLFNHVNQGGFVGNLSSPFFGQSTAINLYRDTSNNRRVQFGTQFSF